MIFASFFDPNSNGWDITDLAAIFGLIIGLGGAVIVIRQSVKASARWVSSTVREIVREEVAEQTRPIQKNANGGKSLPDANKKLDFIAAHLGIELPESLQATD